MNITELNVGFGFGNTDADYAKQFFGLTSILGYGITKNLQGGAGAGLSFYNEGMLVHLFVDLRCIIHIGKISVYTFGDGGFLFNLSDSDYKKKLLLNPGIGIKYLIGNKLSVNLNSGLFIQTTNDKERDSFINFKSGITYTFKDKKGDS